MCNSLFSHNVNSYKDKEDKIVNMIRKGWSAGTVGIAKPALACGEWNIYNCHVIVFHLPELILVTKSHSHDVLCIL